MTRRKEPAKPNDLLDQLLAGGAASAAFEQGGLLDSLKKALTERALNAEMDHHLASGEDAGNTRNGYGRKTVMTETGKLEIEVPRDRQSSFDPQLIAKYQRRFPGFDDKIVSMYATAYAKAASSENTRDAYARDWRHLTNWGRREGFDPTPPSSQVIGLYIGACAAGEPKRGLPPLSVATIERRLSGLAWNFTQRGQPMDRADRHISTVLAGIRRKHAKPPRQKEAVLGDDLIAMIATLGHDLRGLRDRAILLLGFAGGLRRSEIVGLDVTRDDNSDGAGWIEIFADKGVLVTLRGKTGWREVEVGRGSSDLSCPSWRSKPGSGSGASREAPLPPHLQGQQDRRRRAALRQGCRPPRQADRTGRRHTRRSAGRRA